MKNLNAAAVFLLGIAVWAAPSGVYGAGSSAELSDGGVCISTGGSSGLTVSYPLLAYSGGKNDVKPESVKKTSVDGKLIAELVYPSGVSARVSVYDGYFAVSFSGADGIVKSYRFDTLVPLNFHDGGTWRIGGREGGFPEKNGGPKLFQGHGNDVEFYGKSTGRICLRFPESFAWVELQDYREWNWNTFGLSVTTPFNKDKRFVTVSFDSKPDALDGITKRAEKELYASPGAGAKSNVPSLSAHLSGSGVVFDAGGMGKFTFSYPEIMISGSSGRIKPLDAEVNGSSATIKYPGGGVLNASLGSGSVKLKFVKAPEGMTGWLHGMFVPFSYRDGGSWEVDSNGGGFPQNKAERGKVFQGHGRRFGLADANGSKLVFDLPPDTYVEVQDNREWGWNIFWTSFSVPYNSARQEMEMKFALDNTGYKQVKLLDEFGQTAKTFPGKIAEESELKADAVGEDEYYSKLAGEFSKLSGGAVFGRYGGRTGIAGLPDLKKTGFFHVEKHLLNGKEVWILVDPEGLPFFHLGICGFAPSDDFTDISGREGAFEWLPPRTGAFLSAWKDKPGDWWNTRAVSFYKANVVRKRGSFDDNAEAERMVGRVRSFGFNSVGAFSPVPEAVKELFFPYVRSLSYGKVRNIPTVRGMFDPFDPATPAEIDKAMSGGVAKNAEDPLLIGYFLANEQGLEDIPRAIPALDGSYACKRKLVEKLKEKYGDIASVNRAWGTSASSFDELEKTALPVSTREAFADMTGFTEFFLDKYYSVITETFRKYDPNHMLIGNRWQPGTANNEILCRVAGKYMDVISVNYYTMAVDNEFIGRIYRWTGGRPQFWSEFYYTSAAESNAGPSGLDMKTQRERGKAYRNYVENAAATGFVVGVEWFTLIDQAATGRFFEGMNGERNNTGLFSVADRPYADMIDEMLKTNAGVYGVWLCGAKPYAIDDPRFVSGGTGGVKKVSAGRPVGRMEVDGRQDGYPLRPPERIGADRIVSGKSADGLEASFKTAWDDESLYIHVSVTDRTPMCNGQSGKSIWNGDCVELFLGTEKIDVPGPMLFSDRQILLGAGRTPEFFVPNVPKQPNIKLSASENTSGDGYVLEAAIPWSFLGIKPKAGDEILFDIGIDNADMNTQRHTQLMWNGGARNSSDRSGWGRLILVP